MSHKASTTLSKEWIDRTFFQGAGEGGEVVTIAGNASSTLRQLKPNILPLYDKGTVPCFRMTIGVTMHQGS